VRGIPTPAFVIVTMRARPTTPWGCRRACLLLVIAAQVALLGSGAGAQSPTRRLSPHWNAAWGVHFAGPQRASLALGVLGVLDEGRADDALLLLVEPGLGGAKARAGYARSTAFIGAVSLNGAVLRTYGRSSAGADPWRTYVGGELRVVWLLLNVGAGLYAPVSGADKYPGRDGPLGTVTFGIGL
jgi:hypothetical protein